MVDKQFVATKALIVNNDKILLLRESSAYGEGTQEGRYDVPGGRVQPGERFDDSLRREIKEETRLDVQIERPFYVDEWRPRVREEEWQIIATFFVCTAQSQEVTLSEDHDEYVWVTPKEALLLNIIPNLKAVIRAYQEREERQ